jgi:hypothetical protein
MFYHTSLASQWIILAALSLWLSEKSRFKRKHTYIVLWCILAFVTVGLHLYLAVMFCVVLLGYCLSLVIRRTKIKIVAARLFFPLLSIVFAILVFGGFAGDNALNAGVPNYYTSNILALFDSDGWSRFGWYDFPAATNGQYEGFAYLGIGVIGLLAVVLFTLAINAAIRQIVIIAASKPDDRIFSLRKFIATHPEGFSITVVIGISLLLGMGSVVTLGDISLFAYPLPNKLLKAWGIFRSTGRFTWIAVYTITALVIAFISKHYKNAGKYLIIAALLLQFVDLQPFSRTSHETAEYKSPLSNSVWSELSGYSHIYYQPEVHADLYRTFAVTKYAFDNGMTINKSYFARAPKDMPYPFSLSSDTLYFFNSEWEALDMPSAYVIDGMVISATEDTSGNFYQVMEAHPEFLLDGAIQIRPQSSGMVTSNADIAENGDLYTNGIDDTVLFGPYYSTKLGIFDFTLNYEVVENANSALVVGVFDICTGNGADVLKSVEIPADGTSVTIRGISFPDLSDVFEDRVHNKNGAKLRIISIDITKVGD